MIEKNNTETHIFVLYDSIENSVFTSQVLTPLLELKKQAPTKKILLVSFEKKSFTSDRIKQRIPLEQIEVVLLKKYPFLGFWSLYPAVRQLKKILAAHAQYDLIARGPLAGYLCMRTPQERMHAFIIQIRGLLAQEYSYEHRQETSWFKKRVHAWRAQLYENLEKLVFDAYKKNALVHYQVVSDSLKEYVNITFGIAVEHLSIANHDIPPQFSSAQVQTWRAATRTTLGFDERQFVYCYNGSLKSWQCPEKIIAFFLDVLKKNPDSSLLILTPDVHNFEKLLQQSLPQHHYKVISADYATIFRYLAACDAGIIFREDHILNWISRPTKVLEYYAVGLPIIHNATIGLLVKK